MKGFDWLINIIENARIGTIQNRRYLKKDDGPKYGSAVSVFMDLADQDAQNGGVLNRTDEQDYQLAKVLSGQYEELLTTLLSQIPD